MLLSQLKELFVSIDKSLRPLIDDNLCWTQHSRLHCTTSGASTAVNWFKNSDEQVKVLKWFEDFWFFLEIEAVVVEEVFGKKKKKGSQPNTNISISLSVFQGEDFDDKKYQLFRAEWADYSKPDEKRAQPHWHITSSQAIESSLKKYAKTVEPQDSDRRCFLQMLEEENEKVFDVKRMHFAMSADWWSDQRQPNEAYVRKIEEPQQIVNWLKGLLSYLRKELQD